MEFEWDDAKAESNLRKHGVAFEDARAVFGDERVIVRTDNRWNYGELRLEALGMVDARLHVVVFTFREETCRIISARKANKREQKRYGYRSNQA